MKKIISLIIISLFVSFAVKAQETPLQTVDLFLSALSWDRESAYELTNNPAWTSKDKFCSKKAFGGINQVNILEIRQEPNENNQACIYADVQIFDPTNGHGRYAEKYYLEKQKGKWKIVKLKVLKVEKITEAQIPDLETVNNYFENLEIQSNFYANDYKYYPANFTDMDRTECLVECSYGNEYYSFSHYIIMYKEADKWEIAIKGQQNRIDIVDVNNDGIFEVVNDYCIVVPPRRGSWKNFTITSFLYESKRIIYTEGETNPSDGWIACENTIKDDLLYDNTTYQFIDIGNDDVKELVVNYNKTYADIDWNDCDISDETFMQKYTHTKEYQIIYKYNYINYDLSSEKYSIAVYQIEEDYDEQYKLEFMSNINNLFYKMKVELDLPAGVGTNDKIQITVNKFVGSDYAKEDATEELYNKTFVKNLTQKNTIIFNISDNFGCRNLEFTVRINNKIVLKKIMIFECGE